MKLSDQQRLARAQRAQQQRPEDPRARQRAEPGAFDRAFRAVRERDAEGTPQTAQHDAADPLAAEGLRGELAEARQDEVALGERAMMSERDALEQTSIVASHRDLDGALHARDTRARDLDTRAQDTVDHARREDAEQRVTDHQEIVQRDPAQHTAIARHTRAEAGEDDPLGEGDALAAAAEAQGVDAPQDASPVEQAEQAGPASDAHETIARLSREIVEACHVGQDQRQRKVVMLDVQLPGRGRIRARLRHSASGVEVRLRADNPELSALLKRHKGALHERARERGLSLSRVEIAERGES